MDNMINAWNGFLISAGLATIGVLLVVIPLVVFSIAKSPKRDRPDEGPHQED